MQDIRDKITSGRGRLTERTGFLLATVSILLLVETLDRGRYEAATIVALLSCSGIFTLCAIASRLRDGSHKPAACLLAFSAFLLFTTSFLSTGIWSPYMLLLPALPLLASMMIGPAAALWCMGILALSLLLLVFQVTPAQPIGSELELRTGTILLGLLLSGWGGWWHARHINSLAGVVYQQEKQDHLTGLANRRIVESTVKAETTRACRAGSWLTLISVDIDQLNNFNEQFGHQAGDRCLQQVASTLQSGFRRTTDVVGRYEEEEFLAVLPGLSAEQAETMAERLRKSVASDGITLDDGTIEHVTISVGIASMRTRNRVEGAELIDLARQTLQRAKQDGYNRLSSATMRQTTPGWGALEFKQKTA